MDRLKKCAALLTVLMLLLTMCPMALAETEKGDLAARFSDEITLTYQEEEYRLRKRMTNVLFIGMEKIPDSEQYEAVMLILLSVDDAQKLNTPVMLDCLTETAVPAQQEQQEAVVQPTQPQETQMPAQEPLLLGQIVSNYEDRIEGAQATVDAVNAMLPAALIENYVMLDLAGLELLDGRNDADYEARARAIAGGLSKVSSGDVSDLMEKLSPYLTTNMKSGAMMKIVDKADRYDRKGMLRLTVQEEKLIEDESLVLLTDEVWMNMIVETFFEKKTTSW